MQPLANWISLGSLQALCMQDARDMQFGAFGDPGRDPRGWTVTVAYVALVPSTSLGVKAAVRDKHMSTACVSIDLVLSSSQGGCGSYLGKAFSRHASAAFVHTSVTAPCSQDDAEDAQWFDVTDPPQLAFDHKLVLLKGFEHLLTHKEAQQTGMPSCLALRFSV